MKSCINIVIVGLQLGWFSTLTNSISLVSSNYKGDPWLFHSGSNITFVCIIDPYSSVQTWRLNGSDVAKCAFTSCLTINNGSGAFTFIQHVNATYGIFYWTINPVTANYNRLNISCNDGVTTRTATLTIIEVLDAKDDGTNKNLGYVGFVAVVLLIVPMVWMALGLKLRCQESTTTTAQFEWKNLTLYNYEIIIFWTNTECSCCTCQTQSRDMTYDEFCKKRFTLENLKPGHKYRVYIQMQKDGMRQTESKSVTFSTTCIDIEIIKTTEKTADVKFSTNSCGSPYRDISQYLLVNINHKTKQVLSNKDIESGKCQLSDLTTNKKHTIQIQARDRNERVVADSRILQLTPRYITFQHIPKEKPNNDYPNCCVEEFTGESFISNQNTDDDDRIKFPSTDKIKYFLVFDSSCVEIQRLERFSSPPLKPNKSYEFKIQAKDLLGNVIAISQPERVFVLGLKVSHETKELTSTTADFTFKVYMKDDRMTYNLVYQKLVGMKKSKPLQRKQLEGDEVKSRTKLSELIPNTRYIVWTEAMYDKLPRAKSNVIEIKTLPLELNSHLEIGSDNAKATFTWNECSNYSYRLFYKRRDNENPQIIAITPDDKTLCRTISDFAVNTRYTVWMEAELKERKITAKSKEIKIDTYRIPAAEWNTTRRSK